MWPLKGDCTVDTRILGIRPHNHYLPFREDTGLTRETQEIVLVVWTLMGSLDPISSYLTSAQTDTLVIYEHIEQSPHWIVTN